MEQNRAVAQARSESGLNTSLYAVFGLNQSAENFDMVYDQPDQSQERDGQQGAGGHARGGDAFHGTSGVKEPRPGQAPTGRNKGVTGCVLSVRHVPCSPEVEEWRVRRFREKMRDR